MNIYKFEEYYKIIKNSRRVQSMNPYELIMKVNRKMNEDPVFAEKFNRLLGELNRTPGLQQEIMRIAQIQDERKRQKALSNLPDSIKKSVAEMFKLLDS